MRILAVDPGEKRIGIAVSDLSGTIANPLTVLKHVSRAVDSATIAQVALEHEGLSQGPQEGQQARQKPFVQG